MCLITEATFSGELATVVPSTTGDVSVTTSEFLAAFLNRVSNFDAIVSVIYDNKYPFLGLINNLPEYDFAPYGEATQAQPIDRRYIDAIINEMTMRVLSPMACIRGSLPNATILHVPPPPPLREPANVSVREVFKEHVEKHGFLRADLSRKWHASYIDKLRAGLVPLNVDLLDPRFEVACEDEFLKPEYAEGLTHGNSAYGKLVASRIMQLLGL